MDPILGSAIVSGASNLIGNVFGSKSQSSANKANMQIAQMNNDFNAKEAQKARDFILDMWNKTNEYNLLLIRHTVIIKRTNSLYINLHVN